MLRSPLKRIFAAITAVFMLAIATLFAVQNIKEARNGNQQKNSASGMSRDRIGTKNPVLATPESIALGEEIFHKNCRQCHGERAIRNKAKAPCTSKFCPPDLRHPKLWREGEGFVYWTITEGRPPMPRFRGKLTDRQCWDVVNYLRSLGEENSKEDR